VPRLSTWWLLGALIIAIPIAVTSTQKHHFGGVPALGVFLWLEIIWTAAWILYLVISVLNWGFSIYARSRWIYQSAWGFCADFFTNTTGTQFLFYLALVAWGSTSVICRSGHEVCEVVWLRVLKKVLLATVPVSALFLAEDLLMEALITVHTLRTTKGRQLKKLGLYSSVLNHLQFGDGQDPRFWLKTSTESRPVEVLNDESEKPKLTKALMSLFLKDRSVASEKWASRLVEHLHYCSGKGSLEKFYRDGQTYPERLQSWLLDGHNEHDEFFQEEELEKKLFYLTRAEREDIMSIMDKNGDKVLTWGEFAEFRVEVATALRDATKSIKGIKRAARTVNAVFCCLLIFVVAIIYGKIPEVLSNTS
jgi:hypothetical protein